MAVRALERRVVRTPTCEAATGGSYFPPVKLRRSLRTGMLPSIDVSYLTFPPSQPLSQIFCGKDQVKWMEETEGKSKRYQHPLYVLIFIITGPLVLYPI